MFEDIVADMAFSPVLIVLCAAIAIVCFVSAWRVRGSGAKRRERELKRDVLEAKRSIPQLESSVRNREVQIAQLQGEVSELNERTGDLHRDLESTGMELRRTTREARNVTSELDIVKGNRITSDNVIMDGFDDEEPDTSGDSKLAAQLKRTEALYEKLRKGLIKRDERIEQLQEQLGASSDSQGPASPELEAKLAELDASSGELGERITVHERTIEKLRGELSEAHREKDMLADMAKRRSENNQALKQASAEAEAQVPKLEREIESLSKIIKDREASIKRLLEELEQIKAVNEAQEQQLTEVSADIDAHQQVLDLRDVKIQTLESSVSQREERLTALGQELDDTRGELQQATVTVQARERTIVEQQAKVDTAAEKVTQEQDAAAAKAREHAQAVAAAATEHDLAAAALKDTIKDRDFKMQALSTEIESLQSEVENLNVTMQSFRHKASKAQAVAEQRHTKLKAEMSSSRQRASVLAREAQDLQANLEQREKWLAKLKGSLAEREARNKTLDTDGRDLLRQRDALELKLHEQERARETVENTVREFDRQISMANANSKQAATELAEQNQSISVYKSVVQDREFKLASLSDEVANLTTSLDLEKQAGAEATANYDLVTTRLHELENKTPSGTAQCLETNGKSPRQSARVVILRRTPRQRMSIASLSRPSRAANILKVKRHARTRASRGLPAQSRRRRKLRG